MVREDKRRLQVLLAGVLSALYFLPISSLAQGVSVSFQPASREVVDKRLESFRLKDSEREAELKAMFQEAGCETINEQIVGRKDPPNIICMLPGTMGSLIIVGAHLDHAEEGAGVVDDWSGASLLPSLYQALKDSSRRHTFVFVGFTEEEKGLIGSNYYVKHLPREQLAIIRAMVNLECLGVGPTEVWSSVANPELLQNFAAVVRSMQVGLIGVNVEKVGNDDTQAFRDKKIPVITLHSLTQQTLPILHTAKDNLQVIHMDDLYSSYRVITEYLAYIDKALN